LIESLGHHVEDATPDWRSILEIAGAIGGPGLGALVEERDVERLEPRNRATWRAAQNVSNVERVRALPRIEAARRRFLRFWDTYDVLVTPTCGIEPPHVEWVRWDVSAAEHRDIFATFPSFAQPFNLSGQPAISLPLHWSPQGLPIGVQLVGRVFEEATLIRLAAELEQAAPWKDRVPVLET
jgi:amidase